MAYDTLSEGLQQTIQADRRSGIQRGVKCEDSANIRRRPGHDTQNLWHPVYVRDTEKILNCPYYNRYADKTQVFSFCQNDDISRRALHVQLVSRIARNIGRVLGLNLDLIEAIALGHDIGHTPFGHAGEAYLSDLYHQQTGRYFFHNVHSVRVLDGIFPYNITLQTLDGILCHNGEFELREYRPRPLSGFDEFDARVERCYTDPSAVGELIPSTMEGCVVRVCDIIAYLGKDRQDAVRMSVLKDDSFQSELGSHNAEIISNATVNIIENSYGKPYIKLDDVYFNELKKCKAENYQMIYTSEAVRQTYETVLQPMFRDMYGTLLEAFTHRRTGSLPWQHHVEYVKQKQQYLRPSIPYEQTEPNQLVVDYIASMTDGYFLELYAYLFPNSPLRASFRSYFADTEHSI